MRLKYIVKQLLKNIYKRLEFWTVWIIIGVAIDEYIKEGYLFKTSDILNQNITHEKIVIVLLVLLMYLVYRNVAKRNNYT